MSYLLSIGGSEITLVRDQGTPTAVLGFVATTPTQIPAIASALPSAFVLQAEWNTSTRIKVAIMMAAAFANVRVSGAGVFATPYIWKEGAWVAHLPSVGIVPPE